MVCALGYDVSLVPEAFEPLVKQLRSRISCGARILSFGHIGDGNLHVMVCSERAKDPIAVG